MKLHERLRLVAVQLAERDSSIVPARWLLFDHASRFGTAQEETKRAHQLASALVQEANSRTQSTRLEDMVAVCDILEVARCLFAVRVDAGESVRFRRLVLDAIAAGRAHVTRPDGASPPENPGAWGWTQDQPKSANVAPAEKSRAETWVAQGECIGQIHPEHRATILLDPGPALDVARTMALRTGAPLAFASATELAQRLYKAGLLSKTSLDSRGTYTARIRIAGRAVERLWLVDDDSETVATSANSSH